MTAVKERFMHMLPEIERNILNMSDSDVQQIINFYVRLEARSSKPEQKASKSRRQRRLEAIRSGRFTRESGRTSEEIDAEIREFRNERI